MAFGRDSPDRPLPWSTTVLWMVLFFALALTVRIAFNVGESHDEETGRYLYSSNDPYYHDRTVHHILDTGESLLFDPAINFPHGAPNPNPPIFDWTTAPLAGAFEAAGMEQVAAVSLALNLMVAVWSALIVFPTFMIASDLFGRRAGLWAAFLIAVSAPHIQRAVWGFADHDGTTMFFIVLAMAFLLRSLKGLRRREYVADWRSGASVREGIALAVRQNREAFVWAILAGVALAGIALTWKGYAYVLAVMAFGLGFQLLVDHARNRDSTAVFGVYLTALALVVLLPAWYYTRFGAVFLPSTVYPSVYVLLGVLLAGLLLVPTRQLPSILVFPALVVVGALGLVLLWAMENVWAVSGAWTTIFSGLGYFQQSKLYTTIQEAQRTDLGYIAASFGFFAFLLAFWFFGRSVRRAWKGDPAHMLMVFWAVVALFMAFAASRFVMNAAPVFAVLAGGACAALAARLGFDEVRKRYRAQHGQNPVMSGARSLTLKSVLGVVGLALLIVLPNLWLGVDAGIPNEYEREKGLSPQRFGAYGIDYGLRTNGWLDTFNHLAGLDTQTPDGDFRPIAERPGFMAWWDYGHWALDLGWHPTVADPFQNHYEAAGRFLASESEEEGVTWLALLLIDADWQNGGSGYSAEVRAVMGTYLPGVPQEERLPLNDATYATVRDALPKERVFDFFDAVEDATGQAIHYVGVDDRMWPFSVGNSGIFYAPVYLANKNPDEFLQVMFVSQNGQLRLEQQRYAMDGDNNSYQLAEPRYVNIQDQSEWVVIGGEAFPKGNLNQNAGTSVTPILNPTQKFQDSMFRRAYGGPCALDTPAGDGLAHWRVVFDATRPLEECEGGLYRQVALLEYYRGVTVEGRLLDTLGRPMAGVDVAFQDGVGATHARNRTDADGRFSVLAPFSVANETSESDLALVALQGTAVVARSTGFVFSREQAASGHRVTDAELRVRTVNVTGVVYEDVDGNNALGANDTLLEGAQVTVGDVSTVTDAQGNYTLHDLQPGSVTVRVNKTGYADRSAPANLDPASNTTRQDVALSPRPIPVDVEVLDENDAPVAGVPVEFVGRASQRATSDANGTATTTLVPGAYNVTVDHDVQEEDGTAVTYTFEGTLDVPFDGEPIQMTIRVQRTENVGPSPEPGS